MILTLNFFLSYIYRKGCINLICYLDFLFLSFSSLLIYLDLNIENLLYSLSLCAGKILYVLGKEDDMAMPKKFGKSLEFIISASEILYGSIKGDNGGLLSSIEAANQVAGCDYEYGTCWGTMVCQNKLCSAYIKFCPTLSIYFLFFYINFI